MHFQARPVSPGGTTNTRRKNYKGRLGPFHDKASHHLRYFKSCDSIGGEYIHSLTTTSANVHDSVEFENLLHGEEKAVYADSAYANAARKAEFEGRGIEWRVSRKAASDHPLSEKDKEWNREQSRVRAFGEHPFQVVKCLWQNISAC